MAVLQAPVDPLSELSRDEDVEDNRGTCFVSQSFQVSVLTQQLSNCMYFYFCLTNYTCKTL